MQEGNEINWNRKEAKRSLLKTMGSSQPGEFVTSLSTTQLNWQPRMSEFMIGLIMSKTPQKAITLLLLETRDWEGIFFSVGGGPSDVFAGNKNPGGFTLFMCKPKTVELRLGGGMGETVQNALRKGVPGDGDRGRNTGVLCKQGYYIPSNPNDMSIQQQAALNTLLNC
jgi:hypothetical protein